MDYSSKLSINGKSYRITDLNKFTQESGANLSKMPYSIRVLLENALRNGENEKNLSNFTNWGKNSSGEVSFYPARVLMQDFTGVPAVVDLAAMRDAVKKLGGNPSKVNPQIPVDLVIDHSVQVDFHGNLDSLEKNTNLEFQRNNERYKFLKWGQNAFDNFKVVPPGTGICHQVNLEHLAQVVWMKEVDNETHIYPDTLVGTDSHTTMINGLGVLGWGVGGIEAEAAMLGQALPMMIPEVVGVELKGKLKEGVTATDLVLTITAKLRRLGVVGKFVEYFGEGLKNLTLADRATIANMSPEYGATCGFFPVDDQTIEYLKLTGRDLDRVKITEEYCKHQKLWFNEDDQIEYSDKVKIDLSEIQPSLSGPKRPQDRLSIEDMKSSIKSEIDAFTSENKDKRFDTDLGFNIGHGDVVIAAITSCTNTSNPYVMIAAGLVAKKAVELGLRIKPWVKASLAPGSKVVSKYLDTTNLYRYLEELKFNMVGFGCTTCIGNSGPLESKIEETIKTNNLLVASVLSGNRNFEGRVHPLTRANYLASPPLVVAYAIAGTTKIDLSKDVIAKSKNNEDVYLKDIWPSNSEINQLVAQSINSEMFTTEYTSVFDGDETWKNIPVNPEVTYSWENSSTYIKNPPYFDRLTKEKVNFDDINNARILAIFGDSLTTDHISPAGNIPANGPAGKYLLSQKTQTKDFNSFGSRRGNHEIMMRGTFANIRIKNKLLNDKEGGYTIKYPENYETTIYEAAMQYRSENTPLVIFGGKEYGTGSSRDWAAKGTNLLGVKAVICESFERIHRSNLVGMGVLPLELKNITLSELNLQGDEVVRINGISDDLAPLKQLEIILLRDEKIIKKFSVEAKILTLNEVEYIYNGGILQKVVRELCQ